ncbi:MAG: response regulator [Pseudomonadota bacterium]
MKDAGGRPLRSRATAPDGPEKTSAPQPTTVMETLQLFSHDIRSAMSDVLGGMRLIETDKLDGETRTQIDRVTAATDSLAALVDAALMAAAGETLIKSDAAEVDLATWLGIQSGRWSGRARESQSAFQLEVSGTLPDRLTVPQVTLDRILGNLIGNALNHASGAPVTLGVVAEEGQGITLTVADKGPGYPQDVLAQISTKGEAGAMGTRAGSGLGLRIVAELTRQIGGTLALHNAEGGGGVAALHLPEPRMIWQHQPDAPSIVPNLSGVRLLVAEDNLTNQTILRQLLDTMGGEAQFVADGVAALDMLDQQSFDLALIDIEMPRLSGIEVMRHVRSRKDAVAEMPLIALTAYVLRDNREAIYEAGADGIIGKPIASGEEFGRAILRHLGRPSGSPEPEDVLNGRGVDGVMGQRFDETRFQALLDTAGAAGRDELLDRLLEDLTATRELLDVAVPEGDVAEIRAQTHILIAISGAVGADRLQRLAEVLNIAATRRRLQDLAGLYAPCAQDLGDLIARVSALVDDRGSGST